MICVVTKQMCDSIINSSVKSILPFTLPVAFVSTHKVTVVFRVLPYGRRLQPLVGDKLIEGVFCGPVGIPYRAHRRGVDHVFLFAV